MDLIYCIVIVLFIVENYIELVASTDICHLGGGRYRQCEYGCCGDFETQCCEPPTNYIWYIFGSLCVLVVLIFLFCCFFKAAHRPSRLVGTTRNTTVVRTTPLHNRLNVHTTRSSLFFHSGLRPGRHLNNSHTPPTAPPTPAPPQEMSWMAPPAYEPPYGAPPAYSDMYDYPK